MVPWAAAIGVPAVPATSTPTVTPRPVKPAATPTVLRTPTQTRRPRKHRATTTGVSSSEAATFQGAVTEQAPPLDTAPPTGGALSLPGISTPIEPKLSVVNLTRAEHRRRQDAKAPHPAAALLRSARTVIEKLAIIKRVRVARRAGPSRIYALRTYIRETGNAEVTKDELCAYLAGRVLVQGYSSNPLYSFVSNLRAAATALGIWRLSSEDLDAVYEDVRMWQAEAPSEVKKTPPMRMTSDVQGGLGAMASSKSFGQLQAAAAAYAAHNGMFRAGDLFGGAATRADIFRTEIIIKGKTVVSYGIATYYTKTNKCSKESQSGYILMEPGVRVMDQYLAELDRRIPKGTDPKTVPLFPMISGRDGSVDFSKGISAQVCVNRIKTYLAQHGHSIHITGHSFRHGGKTDYLAMGIPNELVDRLGRWTSEASRAYDRRTRIDITRAFVDALSTVSGPSTTSAEAGAVRMGKNDCVSAPAKRASRKGQPQTTGKKCRRTSPGGPVGGAGVVADESDDEEEDAFDSGSDDSYC